MRYANNFAQLLIKCEESIFWAYLLVLQRKLQVFQLLIPIQLD